MRRIAQVTHLRRLCPQRNALQTGPRAIVAGAHPCAARMNSAVMPRMMITRRSQAHSPHSYAHQRMLTHVWAHARTYTHAHIHTNTHMHMHANVHAFAQNSAGGAAPPAGQMQPAVTARATLHRQRGTTDVRVWGFKPNQKIVRSAILVDTYTGNTERAQRTRSGRYASQRARADSKQYGRTARKKGRTHMFSAR